MKKAIFVFFIGAFVSIGSFAQTSKKLDAKKFTEVYTKFASPYIKAIVDKEFEGEPASEKDQFKQLALMAKISRKDYLTRQWGAASKRIETFIETHNVDTSDKTGVGMIAETDYRTAIAGLPPELFTKANEEISKL